MMRVIWRVALDLPNDGSFTFSASQQIGIKNTTGKQPSFWYLFAKNCVLLSIYWGIMCFWVTILVYLEETSNHHWQDTALNRVPGRERRVWRENGKVKEDDETGHVKRKNNLSTCKASSWWAWWRGEGCRGGRELWGGCRTPGWWRDQEDSFGRLLDDDNDGWWCTWRLLRLLRRWCTWIWVSDEVCSNQLSHLYSCRPANQTLISSFD